MRQYDFDLILAKAPTEEQDERIFEHFEGQATPGVSNGVGFVAVHLEATSLDEAFKDAIRRAERGGLTVTRVEMDVADLQAA